MLRVVKLLFEIASGIPVWELIWWRFDIFSKALESKKTPLPYESIWFLSNAIELLGLPCEPFLWTPVPLYITIEFSPVAYISG